MNNTKERIEQLEAEMSNPAFWQNRDRAKEVLRELNLLKKQANDLSSIHDLPAIVTILSGAGGDDAEDFSRMLYEMYQRFADGRDFDTAILHQNDNDHNGYRNITFEVGGKKGAYGILKQESGVHRLVRVSPFSAKKLRHTSFSLVEVVPKFPKTSEVIMVPEQELEVSFARSSGPGGQNVNKRETSVRITHKPTGITVHCESERSQAQNRERALEVLKGKLYRLKEEKRLAAVGNLHISKVTDIEWGNQVRSYVLHPYKLVKDHRTGIETSDVKAVLGGEIEIFLDQKKPN